MGAKRAEGHERDEDEEDDDQNRGSNCTKQASHASHITSQQQETGNRKRVTVGEHDEMQRRHFRCKT